MPADAGTTQGQPVRAFRGRQWFAFLGGAIAWTLHLLSAYAIAEFGCVSGLGERTWLSVNVVAWMLGGVSVLCLLIALAATVTGYRDAAPAPAEHHVEPGDQVSAAEYLQRGGWVLSAIFVLIIVVQSIPILFYLRGC